MSRHHKINASDYIEDDYGNEDYGQQDYGAYGSEEEEEAKAIAASIAQAKADKKKREKEAKAKKKKEMNQKDLEELLKQFGDFFTLEQIKGTLEMNQMDAKKTKQDLQTKKDKLVSKGKTNQKQEVQKKIQVQKEQEEIKEMQEKAKMKNFGPGVSVKSSAAMFGAKTKKKKTEEEFKQMDKKTLNMIYPEIHYFDKEVAQQLAKDNKSLNIVIIGHVDSGKSTLTGHLLYSLGHVSDQFLRKNEKLSLENNKTGFHYAYILDETEEERQRGVTIEVTTRHFSTKERDFTILDAPGHRDFIANMISGAAQANCALLCIDSNTTAFERGWEGYHATTKEHALLARSLGASQIIVAINKLELVNWSEQRYDEIRELLRTHLGSIGYKKADITFVPISGLKGTNLIERATDVAKLQSWYKNGPCLVELLDKLRLPVRNYSKPLRVSVTQHFKQTTGNMIGECISAKIESGVLTPKDELILLPQDLPIQVKSVELNGQPQARAYAGAICQISLNTPPGFDFDLLKNGRVLCHRQNPIRLVKTFVAKVLVFKLEIGAITKGEQVTVHSFSTRVPGRIHSLLNIIDQNSNEVIKAKPKFLKEGHYAQIQIKLEERMALELFTNSKQMGRVTFLHGQHCIAAGIITELIQ